MSLSSLEVPPAMARLHRTTTVYFFTTIHLKGMKPSVISSSMFVLTPQCMSCWYSGWYSGW